jgi:hypothetical protein
MRTLIRWRDAALWPKVQQHVPAGYRAVSDVDRALEIGLEAFSGLYSLQQQQYTALWEAAIERGLQPSGLLLTCVSTLSPVIGHTSPTVAKRFGRFCATQRLWCRVPGRLYPAPREDAPGQRTRCHLILEPE